MEAIDGYENCSKCDGTGKHTVSDNISTECPKCYGEGKIDWITNAMIEIDKTTLINHGTKIMSIVPDANIVFNVYDEEYLKICENGDFLVKGRLVKNDQAVYDGFVNFLKSAGFY